MSSNHNKFITFKKREGEVYVKVTDSFFNKVYEKTVGINDKKGIATMVMELKHKGVDLSAVYDQLDWW